MALVLVMVRAESCRPLSGQQTQDARSNYLYLIRTLIPLQA
jgi:hypothetical protein